MLLTKIRRRCTLKLVAIAAGTPMALWLGILAIAPTGWARARVVADLEAISGRSVAIGSIRLGPLGNLRVRGISVGERDRPGDPWLKIAEARLDVGLLQVLFGPCHPRDLSLGGLDVRVRRDRDGRLEFADLLAAEPAPHPVRTKAGSGAIGPGVNLTFTGARVRLIDEPTGTDIDLLDVNGSASWNGRKALVQPLRARLNGGSVEFAASYDRTGGTPAFVAELRTKGVALAEGIRPLGLLLPVVADSAEAIDGRVDLHLALKGQGASLATILPGLTGHGLVRVDPIDLGGSKLLDLVDWLKQIPRTARVGSVASHFAIGQGKVLTDDLTLKVARLPIVFAGWTDFDGRIEYRVKHEAIHDQLAARLPVEARQLLGEIRDEYVGLDKVRLVGTLDAPVLVGVPTDASGRPRLKDDQKARLREATARLRDRYLR